MQLITIVLIVACCRLSVAEPPARDWNHFPPILQLPPTPTIYALGDVHGDVDKLAQLLLATHIIDSPAIHPENVTWTAGDAVLVCTGDLIDKFPHSMQVLALMRALQSSAEQHGGRVIVTMGNHEAEFLASGGEDKKAADFIDELSAVKMDPKTVAAGADPAGIGQWLRNLPIAAKVGDWFFCHAGNTHDQTLAELTTAIEGDVDAHGFSASVLLDPNSMLEARMHPRPWWDWNGETPALKTHVEKADRAAASDADETRLRKSVAALGAAHLVFGHQPGKIKFADGTERLPDTLAQKFDGLVFFIDTGMSRGVDNARGGLLKIETSNHRATVTAEYADGKFYPLWP